MPRKKDDFLDPGPPRTYWKTATKGRVRPMPKETDTLDPGSLRLPPWRTAPPRRRAKDEEEEPAIPSQGTFSMPSGADVGAKRQDEATKVTRPFKNAGRVVKTAGRFGSLRMK